MGFSLYVFLRFRYIDYLWRKRKLPTAEAVINAVFDLLTREEIESMLDGVEEKTVEDFSMKKNLLKVADTLRPKYSIEDSVSYARDMIVTIRRDPNKSFASCRYDLCEYLLLGLFYQI